MKKLLLFVAFLSISMYTAGEINVLVREAAKTHLLQLRASNICWEVEPKDGKELQECRSKLLDMVERVIESESGKLSPQDEPIITASLDKLHPLQLKYCTDTDRASNSFFEEVMLAEFRFARKCDCHRIKWMIDCYESLRKEALLSSTEELHHNKTQATDSK